MTHTQATYISRISVLAARHDDDDDYCYYITNNKIIIIIIIISPGYLRLAVI